MGRPVAITKVLTAGVDTAVCLSQSPLAAGALTINGSLAAGGVATMTTQRRVIVTSGGDDRTTTFTILGTNDGGSPVKDSFLGTNGSIAQSNIDFKTVTAVYISAASAGTIKVGTNTVGSCPWVRVDPHLDPVNVSLLTELVTGSGTISLDYTYGEFLPDPGVGGAGIYGANTPNPTVRILLDDIAATQDAQPLTTPCLGWRFTIKTGTGTWQVTGTQTGVSGP